MDFLEFLRQLANADIDFVIVGGVAARLHGSKRLTHDIDLVVSLGPADWSRTVDVVWQSGGRPRIPENLETIRDVANVRRWMAEKHMLAMSFRSQDGQAEVDLLVAQAHRLQELKSRALAVTLEGNTYYVASIDDLIEMKTEAGRPQDLLDIVELRRIKAQLARQKP